MEREFIQLDIFIDQWEHIGLKDDDLIPLEEFLCMHPEAGALIRDTGGVRKIRWPLRNRGRSGGIRVLYIDFRAFQKTYLLTVYPKSRKESITAGEKKSIKRAVQELKNAMRKQHHEKEI